MQKQRQQWMKYQMIDSAMFRTEQVYEISLIHEMVEIFVHANLHKEGG